MKLTKLAAALVVAALLSGAGGCSKR
ncbi:MAG: hypothetical protein JWP59_3750, partial [Massilia sp.]|nr:hypothetical protein [Massilia sp.]